MTSSPNWMPDMRTIRRSSKFKKDLRKAQSQGRDLELLKEVILTLQKGQALAARHRDHLRSFHRKGGIMSP